MGYKAMLNIVYATVVVSDIAPFVFYVDSIYVAFEADQLIRHIILFWLVSSFLIIGTRQIARFVINSIGMGSAKREFIIYGAGSAGRSVASALLTKMSEFLGYLDDDESLQGMYVNNYPVLGGINYICKILEKQGRAFCHTCRTKYGNIQEKEVLRILEENSISVRFYLH